MSQICISELHVCTQNNVTHNLEVKGIIMGDIFNTVPKLHIGSHGIYPVHPIHKIILGALLLWKFEMIYFM